MPREYKSPRPVANKQRKPEEKKNAPPTSQEQKNQGQQEK